MLPCTPFMCTLAPCCRHFLGPGPWLRKREGGYPPPPPCNSPAVAISLGGRGNRHLEQFDLHRNGGFSGFHGISVVVHLNPIWAVCCKCIDCISGNAFIDVSCGSLSLLLCDFSHEC